MSVFLLNLEIAYEISDFLSARDYVRHCCAGHALRILHTASYRSMWFRSFWSLPDLRILSAALVLDTSCSGTSHNRATLQSAHSSAFDPGHLVPDQHVMCSFVHDFGVGETEMGLARNELRHEVIH